MKELIGLFCILSFTFRILASMIKALYYVARTLVLLPVAGYKCYKECKARECKIFCVNRKKEVPSVE